MTFSGYRTALLYQCTTGLSCGLKYHCHFIWHSNEEHFLLAVVLNLSSSATCHWMKVHRIQIQSDTQNCQGNTEEENSIQPSPMLSCQRWRPDNHIAGRGRLSWNKINLYRKFYILRSTGLEWILGLNEKKIKLVFKINNLLQIYKSVESKVFLNVLACLCAGSWRDSFK